METSSEPGQDDDITNQPTLLLLPKICQVGRNWISISFIGNGS